MKAARTHAAVTEAQNAGLDDLAAAYAARLHHLDSEETSRGCSDEALLKKLFADEVVAEEAESAEAPESAEG